MRALAGVQSLTLNHGSEDEQFIIAEVEPIALVDSDAGGREVERVDHIRLILVEHGANNLIGRGSAREGIRLWIKEALKGIVG